MAKKIAFKDFAEEGTYSTVVWCKMWGNAIDKATEALEEMVGRGYEITSFFIESSVDVADRYNIEVKGNKIGGNVFYQGREVKLSEDSKEVK